MLILFYFVNIVIIVWIISYTFFKKNNKKTIMNIKKCNYLVQSIPKQVRV